MYILFIGIDVSKDWIDVAHMSGSKSLYLGRFVNNKSGFLLMVKALRKETTSKPEDWFICFENTGMYSKELKAWLFAKSISCREENALQIKQSLGIRRGKSDRADARDICRYAYEKRDRLRADTESGHSTQTLKALLTRRTLLVKQRGACQVAIQQTYTGFNAELKRILEEQTQRQTEFLDKQIKEIERQIRVTIESDEALCKNDDLAQSVIGIGPIISAYLLAYTDNFTLFENARKFASYVGVAPFEHSSGKSRGVQKVSQTANKLVKSVLSNGVQAAIKHDPQLRSYYQRKRAEGKTTGNAMNAIKNKLIHRVFSVIKRQTPYVKLQYAYPMK
jgi:transposase